jgi:DNA replication protein DnaC
MMLERRARSEIKLRLIEEIVDEYSREKRIKSVEVYLDWLNNTIYCPKRFTHAFPSAMPKPIQDWAKQHDGSRGLYLYGDVGTGKTFSLYALAKLFRANKIEVVVKNIPEWLDHLRSFYEKGYNADQELKNEFKKECVMILDDIGSEKASGWTTEIMYRLINNRYEQTRPTIFAGNLNLEQLAKLYGDRITSRIVEMAGKEGIIKLSGDDRRLK